MPGKIHRYLADDHARLDALLKRAAAPDVQSTSKPMPTAHFVLDC
jgi:hypothetical protein